jgi:hypothetical protein
MFNWIKNLLTESHPVGFSNPESDYGDAAIKYGEKNAKWDQALSGRQKSLIDSEGAKTEIVELVRRDQEMRQKFSEGKGSMNPQVDEDNAKRLGQIFDQIGWPTISQFGAEVSNGAWLIIQHADGNIPLQENALRLMKAAPKEEVKQEDIAYLEDRVRKNKGLPQLYGTQGLPGAEGEFEPLHIEDPQHINERRASMGMVPFAVHREMMTKMYQSFRQQSPK